MKTVSVKTYAQKSGAKKAAMRSLTEAQFATVELQQNEEGRWFYEYVNTVQANVAAAIESEGVEPVAKSEIDTPNKVEVQYTEAGDPIIAEALQPKVEATVAPTTVTQFLKVCGYAYNSTVLALPNIRSTSKGLKIEKDREERNGLKRPSKGGKCRMVWDECDRLVSVHGYKSPMPKELKAWAVENGQNPNNAVIEMYQWRKFMGITKSKA